MLLWISRLRPSLSRARFPGNTSFIPFILEYPAGGFVASPTGMETDLKGDK